MSDDLTTYETMQDNAEHSVDALMARNAELEESNTRLRAFVEGFHFTICDNFYKDVSLTLSRPHSLSIRVRVDSSKSWIFADFEKRRLAALRTQPASPSQEADRG